MSIFRPKRRVKGETRVLFDAMHEISPRMLAEALDIEEAKKALDSSAGIFVAKLKVPGIMFNGRMYQAYGARVLPESKDGKQPYVTPHLHKRDPEPYLFDSDGRAEMNFGTAVFNEDGSGGKVEWQKPIIVRRGDEFLVGENVVHALRNLERKKKIDFKFMCPDGFDGHLVDRTPEHPEGDRHIVKHFEGGLPSHFPKN